MISRRELGEREEEGDGRGMGEEKGRARGKGIGEEPSCVSLSISGLGLIRCLPLRISYYLALEINSFAAKSLLKKWIFNLQMGKGIPALER